MKTWHWFQFSRKKSCFPHEKQFNQTTGRNESWKTNNIYDLAGNCWEWTQEAYDTYGRAGRGGSYGYDGDGRPVTSRWRRLSYQHRLRRLFPPHTLYKVELNSVKTETLTF